MSTATITKKFVVVICDACGGSCIELPDDEANNGALRNVAKAQGWWCRHHDAGDMFCLCPPCRRAIAPEKEGP